MKSTHQIWSETMLSRVLSPNLGGAALSRSLSAHAVIAALSWAASSDLRLKVMQQLGLEKVPCLPTKKSYNTTKLFVQSLLGRNSWAFIAICWATEASYRKQYCERLKEMIWLYI